MNYTRERSAPEKLPPGCTHSRKSGNEVMGIELNSTPCLISQTETTQQRNQKCKVMVVKIGMTGSFSARGGVACDISRMNILTNAIR